jgi:hypothetical protein
MERRQGWLFPVMVLAAATVTGFGCLGIAAILGYLSVPRGGEPTAHHVVLTPAYYDALERSTARLLAQVDVAEPEPEKAARSPVRRGAERGR